MTEIDRRSVLLGILRGAAVVAIGAAIMPSATQAVPLTIEQVATPEALDAMDQVIVGPHHHRRRRRHRWVCWWRRGRRVCGWRWVRR